MNLLDILLPSLPGLVPPLLAVVLSAALLLGADYLLLHRHRGSGDEKRFARQIVMLVLTLIAAVFVLLTLPVSEATRGQLISLLGLAVTAAITLSSATFVGNVMAGLMLRSVGNMRPGDYVRVGEHFGRVTVRGLFHTEIQTADRDLTTLPNLYLVSNPVTVVRESGTIVSCDVSLGYDNSHAELEPLLLEAAERAGLTDAFVHVTELGNFSVNYRVAGFLADVKTLLSTRSDLRKHVLDVLHGKDIEIMSPTFMGQRPLGPQDRMIPTARIAPEAVVAGVDTPKAEDIAFDKAEEAEQLEKQKAAAKALFDEVEALKAKRASAEGADAEALDREIEAKKAEYKALKIELDGEGDDETGEGARDA